MQFFTVMFVVLIVVVMTVILWFINRSPAARF